MIPNIRASMEDLVYNKAARAIILASQGQIMISIAKESNFSYCHLVNIFKLLKTNGFVFGTKKGRTVEISLTEKGRKVRELLLQVNGALLQ